MKKRVKKEIKNGLAETFGMILAVRWILYPTRSCVSNARNHLFEPRSKACHRERLFIAFQLISPLLEAPILARLYYVPNNYQRTESIY